MKKVFKRTLIVSGFIFIIYPVIAHTTHLVPFPQFNSPTKQLLDSAQGKPASPYPPTTYIVKAQNMLAQAAEEIDLEKETNFLKTALETTNEGLIFYPNNADLYAKRGEIHAALDASIEDALLFAFSDFKKAYTYDPVVIEYAKKATDIALQLEYYDQAVTLLESMHENNPQDPEILLDLAQTQSKLGSLEQAISSYTKLINLLPTEDIKELQKERETLLALVEKSQEVAIATKSADFPAAIGGFDNELIIASNTTQNNPYQAKTDSNALFGEDILTNGETTFRVKNIQVDENSAIYITPTSETDNTVLYIAAKQTGSFTVAIDKPIDSDIAFKWWIVN